MNVNGFSPVIMIGAHRSGTSMVSRALDDMGLFSGWSKEENNESTFFLGLNVWLLKQCAASWDYPSRFKLMQGDQRLIKLTQDFICHKLSAFGRLSYFGPGKFIIGANFFNLPYQWGWKDPRNTFTLPIWLKIFPQAKVIHVYRHGVDVASSLYVRRNRQMEQMERNYFKHKFINRIKAQRRGFTYSLRCGLLEECFSVWLEYMEEAKVQVTNAGDRAIEVCYESLLEEPQKHLSQIAEHIGLGDEQSISRAVANFSQDRAYAYRKDKRLLLFAETVRSDLQRFGYNA